jgi:hypothetical protein
MKQSDSRYRSLYEQEEMVRNHMWNHSMWRRLRLVNGTVQESEAHQWSKV